MLEPKKEMQLNITVQCEPDAEWKPAVPSTVPSKKERVGV